jgi:hypothetical protein
MSPRGSDAKRRKIFRRAAATIRDLAIRDMVMAAPGMQGLRARRQP